MKAASRTVLPYDNSHAAWGSRRGPATILKMPMSTATCSLEWVAFMSWEWEAESYSTCLLFKRSPLRKKMNLIDPFFSVSFSDLFSLCLAHYHTWVVAYQAHGHVYIHLMEPLNYNVSGPSKNLFRDKQCFLDSWFICGLRLLQSPVPGNSFTSRTQGPDHRVLRESFLERAQGTVWRNYLNKNSLSTPSVGAVGLHMTRQHPRMTTPLWPSIYVTLVKLSFKECHVLMLLT